MLETILLATLIPMAYTGTGVVIFRKVYFKVKSDYFNRGTYFRKKWDNEDGGWYAAGCMAGVLTWPITGFVIGLYYSIVSKHTTPWEKEQQLVELRQKNDQMERELKIGKYAPTVSDKLSEELARKAELHGYIKDNWKEDKRYNAH